MGQTPDEFRAAAADCLEAARRTKDMDAAAFLLQMARKWIELADRTATMEDRLQIQLSEFNDRFFSLAGLNTAASISARKLSNGTTRAIISSGSPCAVIAASRLSASKNPN